MSVRAESVNISNVLAMPPLPPQLTTVVGSTPLFSGKWDLIHDTRDSTFMPTEGHYVDLSFEQVFGRYVFRAQSSKDASTFCCTSGRIDRDGTS